MARIKKAQAGTRASADNTRMRKSSTPLKTTEPTYKDLKWVDTPTKEDSASYRKGFFKGIQAKRKGEKNTSGAFGTSPGTRGFNEGYKKQRSGGKTPAWQRKEGKNPSGGLNAKGVASYRRANPGSKLKTAVTTKPSKLKPGSKAANRRKSFCARMSGMKKRLTSAKTANDPNSRINKSLRKWNC